MQEMRGAFCFVDVVKLGNISSECYFGSIPGTGSCTLWAPLSPFCMTLRGPDSSRLKIPWCDITRAPAGESVRLETGFFEMGFIQFGTRYPRDAISVPKNRFSCHGRLRLREDISSVKPLENSKSDDRRWSELSVFAASWLVRFRVFRRRWKCKVTDNGLYKLHI